MKDAKLDQVIVSVLGNFPSSGYKKMMDFIILRTQSTGKQKFLF